MVDIYGTILCVILDLFRTLFGFCVSCRNRSYCLDVNEPLLSEYSVIEEEEGEVV